MPQIDAAVHDQAWPFSEPIRLVDEHGADVQRRERS